jgi:protein SCO1
MTQATWHDSLLTAHKTLLRPAAYQRKAGRAMNSRIPYFTLTLSLFVSACSPNLPETPPLEGARLGGAFTLTDETGKRVSDTEFTGRYRLVYFGYTSCPDVCPVDVQRLMQGLKTFEAKDEARATKVQPLFISVDPKRDTPAVLKVFTDAFHPRLIGLTGSESEMEAVEKRYGVYSEKDKVKADGTYTVGHSSTSILFGPKGEPIKMLSPDKGPETVAQELDRWVK